MEQRTLQGIERKNLKKGYTRELRRKGKIPAVIYGHSDPRAIAVDGHEFNSKFKVISENIIIKLMVDGHVYSVLVKDFQEDIVTEEILHLDFFEIEKGKHLKTHVPIHTHGTPMGVKEGGIFELLVHEIEVECLPKDLPEDIAIDVTNLILGHSIHVRDLPEITDVRFLNAPDQVVCTVARKREVKEVEVEEEAIGEEAEAAAEEQPEEE
ncbi:MAG: 50S ribosomal protein L25 [Spirochaetales bacterium]|nr:50S ribosomal protein L25 [Spirochaetales bacterium]